MPRPLPPAVMATTGGDPDAVRAHILASVRRVIDTRGLAAASTRAIAEEAGLSGGVLYNYFGNRVELVAAAVVDRAATLTDAVGELAERAGRDTVAQNLCWFVDRAVRVLDDLVPLLAAAFSDERLMLEIRAQIARLPATRPLVDPPGVVERYLRAEQRLGRVRRDADCASVAHLVAATCHDDAFHRHLAGTGTPRRSHEPEMVLLAESITPDQDATETTGENPS
ncbi:TetR/AcrR family transcriptional regulator [Nocardia nepalensis]|uniref:TetR/AcrR family transcriptional regulator n=1 Tax=Nocardia nepalensis TaxID=3375448 RepID=UPI003B680D7E